MCRSWVHWGLEWCGGLWGVCTCIYVCTDRVGSWLSEKPSAHASTAALARQKLSCLAFRGRGQGGACHHLPTKAQVTHLGSEHPPPSSNFLPSPHNAPHPTAVPAEKNKFFPHYLSQLFFSGPPSHPIPPHPLSFHVHGLASLSL